MYFVLRSAVNGRFRSIYYNCTLYVIIIRRLPSIVVIANIVSYYLVVQISYVNPMHCHR